MAPSLETWWKTVTAEVDVPAEQTATCLAEAAAACGFRSRGVREGGNSFVRTELLLLIPTRYEWRIDVAARGENRASFAVRVGLAPGLGYYGAFLLLSVGAIAMGPLALSYPELGALPYIVMAVLLMLPIVQSIALRLRARHFERRLWRGLAGLGPWRSPRIILRSLNQAYGADRIIDGHDLTREAQERP